MIEIFHGRGSQTIRFVPVDATGHVRRVTSATYGIVDLRKHEDSDDRVVVAPGRAAGLGSLSRLLISDAGPGAQDPRRLTLDGVGGLRRGGSYLLSDTITANEEGVTVTSISEDLTEVELTRDLYHPFQAGTTTLRALELEAVFPASVANDEDRLRRGGGPFLITWSYTVDEQIYCTPVEFWITRYGIRPWTTADRMLKHLPGLARSLNTDATPEEAISAATDDVVQAALAAGRDLSTLRSSFQADMAVRFLGLGYLLRGQRVENALELADHYEEKGEKVLGDLLQGKPPHRTARIDPITDQAPAGTDLTDPTGFFVRE